MQPFFDYFSIMNVTDYKRDGRINDLLQRVLDYGERMTNEPPFSFYEMEGRLMSLFGAVCVSASMMYHLEKDARRTLLVPQSIDYYRKIPQFKGLYETLKGILGSVPLFRDRDYQKYPQITVEDVLTVKEEFVLLEKLPHCDRGMARSTNFDATALAYKMYDIIFVGLKGIILLLQNMFDDRQKLQTNAEMRARRWQRMMDDYVEKQWDSDRLLVEKRLDEHIRLHGSDKASLMALLHQLDNESGRLISLSDPTFIFDNRDTLTQDQVNSYLRYIHCRKLLEQEIALCDLRQPAVGAYADLFTNRAAQELAMLLAPVIAKHVDFRHNYHYAAWAMAMMDMGLIYAERRNGAQMMHFINRYFLKGDNQMKSQNQLTQWINKLAGRKFGQLTPDNLSKTLLNKDDFMKLKDAYWQSLSIINKVLQNDLRKMGFAPYLHLPHPQTPHIEDDLSLHEETFFYKLLVLKGLSCKK